jgi:ketopantoate reductase
LVVGAGCVGRVFAYHLARGGAEPSLLVRPRQVAELGAGYALHALRLGRAPRSLQVGPFPLLERIEQVGTRRFDLVLLTMSSAALDASWLKQLLAQIGGATLVSLQPDPADHALIAAALDERAAAPGAPAPRLVRGHIGFVAFDPPLPDRASSKTWTGTAGTAFWFPPLSRSAFSGPEAEVAALVALLRRGGLPVRALPDVTRATAFPNALGMTYLLALEASDWSIAALRAGALLPTCEQALHEAIAIVKCRLGGAPPAIGLLSRTWLAAWGFRLAALFVPFPLLAFVRRHFGKVAPQTHLIVTRLVAEGERAGLAAPALRALLARVGAS